jgi:uncharacterized protein (DUF362 family)/Pyruvate/2-oxoacid:ferredoxin oxidoreductase delta subunit
MFEEVKPRVAIETCRSYDPSEVSEKIDSLLSHLGGLEQFVKPGMKVLLKPNFLSAKEPERAITTHPEIVAAVAREVRKLGGEIIIGDSPGGAKRGVRRVWKNTGMLEMAEREKLDLISFEASGVVEFKLNGSHYFLAKPAVEADLIINLPKLKTHVLTLMTGAVKNMFGLIPGFRKATYHKQFPKPGEFAQIIVDILSLKPPALSIMDAVLAMEGDGPSSGQPRWTNLLFASKDPVALDAIAADIIGLKPNSVPTTRIASDAGLGIGWPEAIDIAGECLEDIRQTDFVLTSNRKLSLIPKFLVRFIDPYIWVRPAIDKSLCTGCRNCITSCPVGALSDNGDDSPIINYDTCINCWCCHELCPDKSVYIDKSWLAEKFIR